MPTPLHQKLDEDDIARLAAVGNVTVKQMRMYVYAADGIGQRGIAGVEGMSQKNVCKLQSKARAHVSAACHRLENATN